MRFIEISVGGAPSRVGARACSYRHFEELAAPIRQRASFVPLPSCFLSPYLPITPAAAPGSAAPPRRGARPPLWRGPRTAALRGLACPRRSGGGYIGGIPVGIRKNSPRRRIRPYP